MENWGRKPDNNFFLVELKKSYKYVTIIQKERLGTY